MPADYFVIADGKLAYEYPFYELESARKFAQSYAREKPGTRVMVLDRVNAYFFEKTEDD